MSEDFKNKLKAYQEGHLSSEEQTAVEQEMEKMEAYQAYLEELVQNDSGRISTPDSKQEVKIIRKGKWKARFTTALTLLGFGLLATILSGIVTSLFYGWGENDRMTMYKDAVSSAIAISQPNVEARLSADSHFFFNMDLHGNLVKQIGGKKSTVGEFSQHFLLAQPGLETKTWFEGDMEMGRFQYPGELGADSTREWNRLEKLPEGTVAEAFISFNRLFTTDELLAQFKDKNLDPAWFAVDTGVEQKKDYVLYPIGFPSSPLWHADDMKTTSISETSQGLLGGSTVLKTSSSPSIKAYGSGDVREANFMKTLHLLQTYKPIAKKIVPFLKLDESIAYLEKNGVKIYGVVVTGPTKEVLKLRQESWISSALVGKVQLWNWEDK